MFKTDDRIEFETHTATGRVTKRESALKSLT